MKLIDNVIHDISYFLASNDEFFFNERDFQMHLALFLIKTGNYKDVDVEYHIPREFKADFNREYSSWDTKTISIDIMIRKDQEFVPVELKYKLKGINSTISRLGESSSEIIPIVTNQAAQDLGRYDFWKDVRRIELLKKYFHAVSGGVAVFLTNDKSYMKEPKPNVKYYNFRMDGVTPIGGKMLEWNGNPPVSKGYNAFPLTNSYNLNWQHKIIRDTHNGLTSNVEYYYCVAQI